MENEEVMDDDFGQEATDADFGITDDEAEQVVEPESTEEQAEQAEKVEVKTEEVKPQPEAWDKERQRADQAEANFRKAQAERQSIEAKLSAESEKAKSLEEKLSTYVKANEINLDDIDSEYTDPKLVNVLKAMQSQIAEANARAAKLEEVKERYEQVEREKDLTNARENAKNEIIADIEAEYPAKHRNEAVKLADKICADRGYSPKDRYEASKLLRQCYKDLASKEVVKPKVEKVPTDTGQGGNPTVTTEVKSGSIKSVAAEWRKKLKS